VDDNDAISITINQFGFSSEQIVIDFIDLSIPDQQFVCIVGPSGCGKSSLLNCVAGLYPLTNTIKVDYQDKQTLGYIFQEPRLLPWLSVYDNIALVSPDVEPDHLKQLLADVGLAEHSHHFPNTLSGGMQRRASIARAFAVNPTILLLDEPFVSLDAPTAKQCRDVLMKLAKRFRTTILFVTHDLSEALYLADNIVFLSNRPTKVIHQFQPTRTSSIEDENITQMKTGLLRKYPGLLSGILS
jgi:NitT/TauT family transport system ATP-binding protein